VGKVTKSTPFGSIDRPFNPLQLAHGADASFIARSVDRNPTHLKSILTAGHSHRGTSFIEIYQNCNVFNDGAFEVLTDKSTKEDTGIFLEEGRPLIFGKDRNKGILLDGLSPRIVDLEKGEANSEDLWVHDSKDRTKAYLLCQFFGGNYDSVNDEVFPRPFGILFQDPERACYEDQIHAQNEEAKMKGNMDLDAIISGRDTWLVE
jgi:2-oxoglutarate ferredoxin oxidoreductase subunit beta